MSRAGACGIEPSAPIGNVWCDATDACFARVAGTCGVERLCGEWIDVSCCAAIDACLKQVRRIEHLHWDWLVLI